MPGYRDIVLPEIGAGPHAIRVVQWLVDQGAEVAAGDRVLEVIATGVLFSVSAPAGGVLASRLVRLDDVVRPGDRLGAIDVDEVDDE